MACQRPGGGPRAELGPADGNIRAALPRRSSSSSQQARANAHVCVDPLRIRGHSQFQGFVPVFFFKWDIRRGRGNVAGSYKQSIANERETRIRRSIADNYGPTPRALLVNPNEAIS